MQFKLLDLFRQYSVNYKIQIVFTTHSLSSVEYARFNRTTLSRKVEQIADRKNQIVVLNYDAKQLLQPHELKRFYKAFINLDPPYVKKGRQLYKNAFSEDDHRELSKLISACKRKWIVTYDICPLVADLYSEYRSTGISTTRSIRERETVISFISVRYHIRIISRAWLMCCGRRDGESRDMININFMFEMTCKNDL